MVRPIWPWNCYNLARVSPLVRRMAVSEPTGLRFFETFVVKFRLFLVWREEPDRENEKR
jgi:hypothetical protein